VVAPAPQSRTKVHTQIQTENQLCFQPAGCTTTSAFVAVPCCDSFWILWRQAGREGRRSDRSPHLLQLSLHLKRKSSTQPSGCKTRCHSKVEHISSRVERWEFTKTGRQAKQKNADTFLYLYLLSTTMLYHRVLANSKSCKRTAQHVALCRRVKGLRGGLSHSDSHKWLSHSALCSSHRRRRGSWRSTASSEWKEGKEMCDGVNEPLMSSSRCLSHVCYLRPPPQSPPVHRFSHCQLTATPQPGSSSCFLSADLWPRRTVASMQETDLMKEQQMTVRAGLLRWLKSLSGFSCLDTGLHLCCRAKYEFSTHYPGWYPLRHERCQERYV